MSRPPRDDAPDTDEDHLDEPVQSHRGGFGEFGGETAAFIERTFRERIIMVGVSFPPHDEESVEESLDELELLVDTAGADVVARVVQRRSAPGVSMRRVPSPCPSARRSAWPRQRMPLPEISASEPSEFNSTMHASSSLSDGASP